MYTTVRGPLHGTGDKDKEKSVKQQFVYIETCRFNIEAHPMRKKFNA